MMSPSSSITSMRPFVPFSAMKVRVPAAGVARDIHAPSITCPGPKSTSTIEYSTTIPTIMMIPMNTMIEKYVWDRSSAPTKPMTGS